MIILILAVSVLTLIINIFLVILNLKYIDYFEEILNSLEEIEQIEDHHDVDKSGKELINRLHEFQKMKFSGIQSSKREKNEEKR